MTTQVQLRKIKPRGFGFCFMTTQSSFCFLMGSQLPKAWVPGTRNFTKSLQQPIIYSLLPCISSSLPNTKAKENFLSFMELFKVYIDNSNAFLIVNRLLTD